MIPSMQTFSDRQGIPRLASSLPRRQDSFVASQDQMPVLANRIKSNKVVDNADKKAG